MKNSVKQYLLAGFPFIVIGLLLNPWLVSWLFNANYTTTIFGGILFISILLIVIGWGIIFKKQKFLSWLLRKYKGVALILLNLIVLFGLINFIAAIILFIPIKLHDGKSENHNHINDFDDSPASWDDYNVGLEGIRFDQKVNSYNVESLINGAVWVFGGSTTFGHGVKDDETITAYLNRLDTSNTYLNFGGHDFNQSNEIDKLLSLLKMGYTPSGVIFIDGLNDVTRILNTNFHPTDTLDISENVTAINNNSSTKLTVNQVFKQLPVARLLKTLQYAQLTHLGSLHNEIDTVELNQVISDLREMYRYNYQFLLKISDAFGVPFSIYYQPVGILSYDNPFWKDTSLISNTPLYANINYIVPKMKLILQDWNLPSLYDITEIDDSCASCYVDLIHYDNRLNRILAIAILNTEEK